MPRWWNELSSAAGMYRALPALMRAQRDIGRAHRRRSEGRYSEAFGLAVSAFGVLSRLAAQGHPGAMAIISVDTVFLDELAKQVGQEGAAREELQQALLICRDTAEHSPALAKTLEPYIGWYEYRLSEEPVSPTH